jgi:hypothetical protein
MRKNAKYDLTYLLNKPTKIWWKVIAGERKLSILEEYDLIFDDYDRRIRKLI